MVEGPLVCFPGTIVGIKIFSARSDVPSTFLEENGRYEYELDSTAYSLNEVPGIITHSRISHAKEQGLIEPGNYVGLLKVELRDKSTEKKADETYLEVRSRKLEYDSEYRVMLEDITSRCADFLLQLESPAEQHFKPEDEIQEATLAQRLYFLKSLLDGEEFQQALQRIVTMPNTCWREEFRTIDVRQSCRLGRYEVRQVVSAGRRMEIPAGHPLRTLMKTIPEQIEVRDKRDTVDTPENRFVKYALNTFLQTLEEMVPKIGNDKYPGLRAEIDELINDLEETVSHGFFKEVSFPELLPLNSPVLQRKEGYRHVLRTWMLLELAAKLSWTGGDDIYAGGKRDAAALYEYWVFFRLLDLVADLFELDKPPVASLIDDKDFVLKLKAGSHLPIRGVYSGAGRTLQVQFSYNRTFDGAVKHPAQGSWSRQMRPDYTLSLWPDGFSADEAENQELITHIHFDAKYKVDRLVEMFGKENDNLTDEKIAQRAGIYKRADLLKMHAYRDAIRRSSGAYVIYPGTDSSLPFQGFHELLPGLGAFPLRPGTSDDGSVDLMRFLKEVVAHVCNRMTQREQHTYHTYRIYKDDPPTEVREALPEKEYGTRQRLIPPSEISVLVGYYKDQAHIEWILKGPEKLFNCRADVGRGSLRLESKIADAAYLLLHTDGETKTDKIYRIIKQGPRVFSADTLIEKGYPHRPSRPYYLVYEVDRLKDDNPLNDYEWNLQDVPGWKSRRGSALPFGVKLSDLMLAAKRKT
jgi:predicted component of viral defense system (DUF524 family)